MATACGGLDISPLGIAAVVWQSDYHVKVLSFWTGEEIRTGRMGWMELTMQHEEFPLTFGRMTELLEVVKDWMDQQKRQLRTEGFRWLGIAVEEELELEGKMNLAMQYISREARRVFHDAWRFNVQTIKSIFMGQCLPIPLLAREQGELDRSIPADVSNPYDHKAYEERVALNEYLSSLWISATNKAKLPMYHAYLKHPYWPDLPKWLMGKKFKYNLLMSKYLSHPFSDIIDALAAAFTLFRERG